MGHNHSHNVDSTKVLIISTVIAMSFAIIEVFGGWWANSLALLSDGGHMFADSLSLVLAAFAAWISKKPPSQQHTYGLDRAEVIGAWISSLMILGVGIAVIIEAIERFSTPTQVDARIVIVIGALGIIVNTLIAWILSRGEKNLNVRAAILHVLSDLLGSFAALITGVVIYATDWHTIDPILSIFISILILISSVGLIRESFKVLMEGVPAHIDSTVVRKRLALMDDVESVHDFHIWSLSSGRVAMSAHITITKLPVWERLLPNIRTMLHNEFNIDHITVQPETKSQTHEPHHEDNTPLPDA